MGSLKTLGAGLLLILGASTVSADTGLRDHVASCVGRMSAQMEHYWLFHDRSADRIEESRAQLLDLLAAMTTEENASEVLAGRINAKLAHAALLTRASFSTDAKQSAWATKQAQAKLDTCADMVLHPPEPEAAAFSMTHDSSNGAKTLNQSAAHISQ